MSNYTHHVALLGGGTIGLSMIALHLRRPDTKVTLYDPRPDNEVQLRTQLPAFLDSSLSTAPNSFTDIPKDAVIDNLISADRLVLASSVQEAVSSATIIQEQTPERLDAKRALWNEVAQYASPAAHLWSSSSGIPASAQSVQSPSWVKENLLVAHPFNPPHIMPLVEIVPGPETKPAQVEFVKEYFKRVPGPSHLGPSSCSYSTQTPSQIGSKEHYRPIVLRKEIPGFAGNRLAFALLREACYLVGEGVVSAPDLDAIVTASLGPRWAGSGVFESYHAGGGEGGIGGFLEKLAPTLKDVWGQLGEVEIRTEEKRTRGDGDGGEEGWRREVVRQSEEAYGPYASAEEKAKKQVMLRGVIEMQKQCWSER